MKSRTTARLAARAVSLAVFSAFGLLATASPALAQGKGGPGGMNMPKPEDIQKKVGEFLDKCDTVVAESEGFCKLTYKAIPTSPDEIMKTIGDEYKDKIPKGYNIDDFLKAYQPQIQEYLNTYLAEAKGFKFEAFQDLKWKSKKIPKGEYKVSLVAEGEELKSIVFLPSGAEPKPGEKPKKDAGKNVPVHFKGKQQKDPFAKLHFEFKKVEKKTDNSFELFSQFFRTEGKTTDVFKPGEEPKKDDKDKKDAPKDDPAKKDAPKDDPAKKDDSEKKAD